MNKWLCCALLVVSRGQEAADHLGSGPPLLLMGTKPPLPQEGAGVWLEEENPGE